MGINVNKKQLADIFGLSQRTLTELQRAGLPIEERGARGRSHVYDTARVFAWFLARETVKHKPNGKMMLDAAEERALLWRAQRLYTEKRTADINAEVIRRTNSAVFTLARIARDQLEALPDRLASILAAEADERRIYALMANEIRAVLTELSRGPGSNELPTTAQGDPNAQTARS